MKKTLGLGSWRLIWFALLGLAVAVRLVTEGVKETPVRGPDSLVASAARAGDYLVRVLDQEGRFLYSVNPDSKRRGDDYNWLRHAGTIIALCQLHTTTGRDEYREAARLAAGTLLDRVRETSIHGYGYLVLVSEGKSGLRVKTGGCALAAIALMYVDAAFGTRWYKHEVLRLCDYLRFAQKEDGDLHSKLDLPAGEFSTWRSDFYAGQALLALALAEARYPRPENRAALVRLATFLANRWRQSGQGGAEPRSYDHWGMIGLHYAYDLIDTEALARIDAREPWTREKLLRTAVRYTAEEVRRQIVDSSSDRGSFRASPGRLAPTSTRIEGITAIANLVRSQKDHCAPWMQDEVASWQEAIASARRFVLDCQYSRVQAASRRGDVDVSGAFHRGADLRRRKNARVRIDYCQHAISAILEWPPVQSTL